MFNTITEVIEDLKQGKMVIVVDDESRENEGDLTIIAETLDVSLDYLILGLMPRLTATGPVEDQPAQPYPAWIWRTDAEHRMAAPNNKSGGPPFLNHGERRWEYGLNPSIPWAEVEAIMDRRAPLIDLVFQYFYNGQLDTIVVSGGARYNEQGEFLGYSGPGDHLDAKAFAAYREAILFRASAIR